MLFLNAETFYNVQYPFQILEHKLIVPQICLPLSFHDVCIITHNDFRELEYFQFGITRILIASNINNFHYLLHDY